MAVTPTANVTAPHPQRNPKAIAVKTVEVPAFRTASDHTGRKMLTTTKGMMINAKRNPRAQVFSHLYRRCILRGTANAPPATAARNMRPKPGTSEFIDRSRIEEIWDCKVGGKATYHHSDVTLLRN